MRAARHGLFCAEPDPDTVYNCWLNRYEKEGIEGLLSEPESVIDDPKVLC